MRLIEKFYIKNKSGEKVQFRMNKAQRDYEGRRTGRDIILKARQLGFSTYEQLRKFESCIYYPNISTATVAHKKDKATDIFRITRFAYDSLPESFKTVFKARFDNVGELSLANGSRYYVDNELRSGTVQDLHVSEVAYKPNYEELFAGSLETVPKNGFITFETTANGLNSFADLWNEAVEGKNEWTPHFYNWTWEKEYRETLPETSLWKEDYKLLAKKYELITDLQSLLQISDEQFYWYYLKVRRQREMVKQEYPSVPEEAFLSSSISVFDLYSVSQLKGKNPIKIEKGVQIYEEPIKEARYILGSDTSEGIGGDFSSIEIVRVDEENEMLINVASFRDNKIRPDQLAVLLIQLGWKYNTGFIIPERNGSGLTTVLKIQEDNYPNLYVNKSFDKRTERTLNEYGWRTTGVSRDLMIDDFIERFESGGIEINSPYLIQEMKTFVRKENGKREHDDGYHDDSLFGIFLANQGVKFHRGMEAEIQDADYFGF